MAVDRPTHGRPRDPLSLASTVLRAVSTEILTDVPTVLGRVRSDFPAVPRNLVSVTLAALARQGVVTRVFRGVYRRVA